jgi:hypothetical protein
MMLPFAVLSWRHPARPEAAERFRKRPVARLRKAVHATAFGPIRDPDMTQDGNDHPV